VIFFAAAFVSRQFQPLLLVTESDSFKKEFEAGFDGRALLPLRRGKATVLDSISPAG